MHRLLPIVTLCLAALVFAPLPALAQEPVDGGTLALGQTVEGTLEAGTTVAFSFSAAEQTGYLIELSSEAFDPTLAIYSGTTKISELTNISNNNHNTRLMFIPPAAGEYSTLVSSSDSNSGAFSISMSEPNLQFVDFSDTVIEVPLEGANPVYFAFHTEVNDVLAISVTNPDDLSMQIWPLAPGGNRLSGQGGWDVTYNQMVIDRAGYMALELTMNDETTATTALVVINRRPVIEWAGEPVTVELTAANTVAVLRFDAAAGASYLITAAGPAYRAMDMNIVQEGRARSTTRTNHARVLSVGFVSDLEISTIVIISVGIGHDDTNTYPFELSVTPIE